MGLPSTSIESLYRNNMDDVKNFFENRHKNNYKVYNLCEEKQYPENTFYQQGYYPFKDHEAPPLNLIKPFVEDAKNFLEKDPKNVVAIHCKAGKGRTGTFVSCLLLYLNFFTTADDCLRYYGMMRVETGKGVTVPSQIRYVFYFEEILKKNMRHPLIFKTIIIKKIRMITVPDFGTVKKYCCPTFKIENSENVFNSIDSIKKKEYECTLPYIDFQIGKNGFQVTGDVKITFYHNHLLNKDKIFKLWFNTLFIPEDGELIIEKNMIDKACKDKNNKHFKQNFAIEIHCIEC